MLALSPVGVLLLLLEGVRDAMAGIDLDSVQFSADGREWAYKVPAGVKTCVLGALDGLGAVGQAARDVMGKFLQLADGEVEDAQGGLRGRPSARQARQHAAQGRPGAARGVK